MSSEAVDQFSVRNHVDSIIIYRRDSYLSSAFMMEVVRIKQGWKEPGPSQYVNVSVNVEFILNAGPIIGLCHKNS